MKGSNLLKRILALTLSVILALAGIGTGGLKSVQAADNDLSFVLKNPVVSSTYVDEEETDPEEQLKIGSEIPASELLKGEAVASSVISNSNAEGKNTLYMDVGTAVKFDIDVENNIGYHAWFSQPDNSVYSSDIKIISSLEGGSDTIGGNVFFKLAPGGKSITIWTNPYCYSNRIQDFYISFAGNGGKFTLTLNVRLMTKSTAGGLKVTSNFINVRGGKHAPVFVQIDAENATDGTDSYQWSVSDPSLGSVTYNADYSNAPDERQKTNTAIFQSDNSKIGNVNVIAETMCGLSQEDIDAASCLAIQKRGDKYIRSFIVTSYIPATSVEFKKDTYTLVKGTVISDLNSLINATSDQNDKNPNDDFVYSMSKDGYAIIDGPDMGISKLTATNAGEFNLFVSGEQETVKNTKDCKIIIVNPTDSLNVSLYDNIIASTSGSISKSAQIRSKNVLDFVVKETAGASEALVCEIDGKKTSDYLDVKCSADNGSEKKYEFTAKNVDSKKIVNVTFRTDREEINGQANNVQVSFRLTIYPAFTDSDKLVTKAIIDENEFEASEVDLYSGESVVVTAAPSTFDGSEAIDQILWSSGSPCISRKDYTFGIASSALNSTTVSWAAAGDPTILSATAKSNSNVKKDFTINTKTRIDSISLAVGTNSRPTLNVGATAKITPTVTPAKYDEEIVWESTDPSAVKVDDKGNIEALKVTDADGVVINAYPMHKHGDVEHKNTEKVASIVIRVSAASNISVEPETVSLQYGGFTQAVTATVIDENTHAAVVQPDVNWSTDSTSIIAFNDDIASGETVTLKSGKVGNTKITATYTPNTKDVFAIVTAPLTDPKVTLSGLNTNVSDDPGENPYIYLPNGKKQDITPVLTANGIDSRKDEYKLVSGSDYSITDSFKDGNPIGVYSFTFDEGTNGLYTGSRTESYRVFPKSLGEGTTTVAEKITVKQVGELIFNGDYQEPVLDIVYKDGTDEQKLVKGTDYVTEGAQVNVPAEGEKYKLKVTGIGNFSGSFEYEYVINPFDLEKNLEAGKVKFGEIPDRVYTGSPITVDENLAVNVQKRTEEFDPTAIGVDYDYEYSSNVNAGDATITITGKGNYTGTVTTTFKIAPKNVAEGVGIELTVAPETIKYTGAAVEPALNVTYGENELIKDTDYSISYVNNIDSLVVSKENAKATITGKGNYTGTAIKEFAIYQADMSDTEQVTIDSIPDQFDVGAKIKPDITGKVKMKDSGVVLVAGKDYLVSYGKDGDREYNFSIGQGVVTITPAPESNFVASKPTTVTGAYGQEAFFNIVKKTNFTKANDIQISSVDEYGLAGGKIIYVNVERQISEGVYTPNSTRIFNLKSVTSDGSVSDDPVFATVTEQDAAYFDGGLQNLDATQGGEAVLSITGRQVGTASLTLQTKGGTTKRITVVVNDPATSIGIDLKDAISEEVYPSIDGGNQLSIYENHDYYLIANLREGQTDKVTWSVDDESVAVVNAEGKLTTKKAGSVTVTCTTNPSEVSPGGVVRTATLNIIDNLLAQEVTIDQTSVDLQYKTTMVLNGEAKRTIGNVTEVLEWTSSNENVVKVIDGKNTGRATIEAVGPGTATVSYGSKLSGGVRATCTVNVVVPVTEVKLNKNEETVKQNGTVQLIATLNEYAQDEFVWTSSNEAGVKIIAGTSTTKANTQTVTIQGIKNGEDATITVTSKSTGFSASCKVSVVGVQTSTQPGTTTPPKTIKDEKGGSWAVASTVKPDHLKTNLKVADKSSGGKYKITKLTKKNGKVVGGTVAYMAPYNKNTTKMTAPNKVKIGGVAFSVTSIASNAFKGCTKLKSATIGTNVTSIGNGAFSGCTSLKTVTIKSTKLTKIGSKAFYGDTKLAKVIIKSAKMNSVGANAFKKTPQNIKVKVPAAKVTNYTKLLRKGGISKTAKITK